MKEPAGYSISHLILEARTQCGEAQNRLFDHYRNYLKMIARLLANKSAVARIDPSDLVQETLLRAHERFSQFKGVSEPEMATWLRQILTRLVIDFTRREQASTRRLDRQQSLHDLLDDSLNSIQFLTDKNSSPSHKAEQRELGVILANSLANLSVDHREVVLLRNIEQLEWPDISEKMGRSTDAVRMLWTRALRELRDVLEE
ncbi:MAG: sigma-70 family RNA polymerase sigma factor [Planctomycetales bacterium]|nr:sigma-70 family RNA polymerase sigma factor [Planctomycetales bacterium]